MIKNKKKQKKLNKINFKKIKKMLKIVRYQKVILWNFRLINERISYKK